MIARMPEYCREFHCIAGDCKDSCCVGWEIEIDARTAAFYDNVKGAMGERLRAGMSQTPPRCFLLGEGERCPFLNAQNLCDIILELGESSLCQICRDHPRYFEWFDGLREGGIGLGCEEAARIILGWNKPFVCVDEEVPEEECDSYAPELFACLHRAREIMIGLLQQEDMPFAQRIGRVLAFAEQLQERVDNGELSLPDVPDVEVPAAADSTAVLEFLLSLEPIDVHWQPWLTRCIEALEGTFPDLAPMEKACPAIGQYLRNIAVYFLWRYFLKGVFDGEFLSRVKLMAVSTGVIAHLFFCEWKKTGVLTPASCAEIAKRYSKEVEYSEENLNAMLDAAYELPAFARDALTGLLHGIV